MAPPAGLERDTSIGASYAHGVDDDRRRTYHLHIPWVIPTALLDTFLLSYPAKRYQSTWISIAGHSAQTVVIGLLVLTVVV